MKIKQERKNIMKTDVIKTAVKENKKSKMAVLCRKLKENIKNFWQDEDGMGVVEIVLIIVVLIGLVIIFKSQITALVNKLLSKMSSQANKI
jgi:Flp pilus assembly pilin Flp